MRRADTSEHAPRLVFTRHAAVRMFRWRFSEVEVADALSSGQVIEQYPNDLPYPSRLVLHFVGPRPVHVVAADIPTGTETVVITVYEPDPERWDPGFRVRRVAP